MMRGAKELEEKTKMKRILLPTLVIGTFLLTACGAPTTEPEAKAPPPEQMQPKPESPFSEDWAVLNRWLDELYGLPPVYNTEELEAAAFIVSSLWFDVANEAVKKLEQQSIPWGRTSPFFYLYAYYVLHDIQLRNFSSPLEFMAVDQLLAQSVKDLHEAADELVLMKQLGETLNIFPTEEAAMKWFKEFDKDWERLMEEAIEKAE